MQVQFKWDERKEISNLAKHRVNFEEASTVFSDPLAKIFNDRIHSDTERREIIIGHSSAGKLLLVCFTEHDQDTVRIISARLPTKKERKDYEENI